MSGVRWARQDGEHFLSYLPGMRAKGIRAMSPVQGIGARLVGTELAVPS